MNEHGGFSFPKPNDRLVGHAGTLHPKAAFFFDEPTPVDLNAGSFLQGTEGYLTRKTIDEAGFFFPDLYLSYLVGYSTGETFFSAELRKQETAIRRELIELKRAGVSLFVAFGPKVAGFFGIIGNATDIRGSLYEIDLEAEGPLKPAKEPGLLKSPALVLVTFSPAYVNASRNLKNNRGKVDTHALWLTDLKKAKRIVDRGHLTIRENFNLSPTLAEVRDFVEGGLVNRALFALDLETTSLEMNKGLIVVLGLAIDGETALSIPFYDDLKRPYWTISEEQEIRVLINRLLSEGRLLLQNALFDIRFLMGHGFHGATFETVEHDTLLLQHTLNPELPAKLGFITSLYGTTPYWKDEFLNRAGGILDMDQMTLRKYNLRDCVVLHQVLQPMLNDLNELPGALSLYRQESLPLLAPIAEMMDTGVELDVKGLKAYRKELEKEIAESKARLYALGGFTPGFNIDSDADLRLFLFGELTGKFAKLTPLEGKKPGTKVFEELALLHEVRDCVRPLWQPASTHAARKTQSGLLTVNKQGRLGLQRMANNRLADLKRFVRRTEDHLREERAISSLLEWLDLYQQYAESKKLLSTYTKFPIGEDGRIHTQLLITGTATGRLASKSPNLQNIPKKNLGIRRTLKAADGKTIVAADYSNLEVKVLAYETLDAGLLEVVDSGANVHDVNTRLLFGLDESSPMWKLARRAAKIFQFGGLSYGGGDNEIYEKIILDVPNLGLTFAHYKEAKARWMDAHPGYVAWRERLLKQVLSTRQVTNAFGRTRTFYGDERDITKEAMNFPIQSAAASIINRAVVAIWRRIRTAGLRARLQIQIHDEIRIECPIEEREQVISILMEEMQRPIKMHGHVRQFECEVTSGPNWADLDEVSK